MGTRSGFGRKMAGLALAGVTMSGMALTGVGASAEEAIGGGPMGGRCHYNRQASLPDQTCGGKLTEAHNHCIADIGDGDSSARYTACVDVMMKVAGFPDAYGWDDSSGGFVCLPES